MGQVPFPSLHLYLQEKRDSSTAWPLSLGIHSFIQDQREGLAALSNKKGNEHRSIELILGKWWTEEMVLQLTAYRSEGESANGRGYCKFSFMAMYQLLAYDTGESK